MTLSGIRALVFAQLALLLFSAAARAGMMSPCSDPIVLAGPKVQVFILPLQSNGKLTPQGRELATILQRHVLFAALKYPSIGVEELTLNTKACPIEELAPRVLSRLRAGQSAVFFYGRLFEQGSAIHLQSIVQFATRDRVDTLAWQVTDGVSSLATLPGDPIRFAPRVIPLFFLQSLQAAQVETRRLRKTPDVNAAYFELPDNPESRIGFEVLETRGDWMHLRLIPSGDDGWVPAHSLADGQELKGVFPELYFVDGLIGYHELWGQDTNLSQEARRRIGETARASFDRYIELSTGRAESDARAAASVLKGSTLLRGADARSDEYLSAALRDYARARELAPASTLANNFYLACDLALCAHGNCSVDGDSLHRKFLSAIAQDPTNADLLNNLQIFYATAERGTISTQLSPADLTKQRAVIDRAREQ